MAKVVKHQRRKLEDIKNKEKQSDIVSFVEVLSLPLSPSLLNCRC